jgi:hypothetical protein
MTEQANLQVAVSIACRRLKLPHILLNTKFDSPAPMWLESERKAEAKIAIRRQIHASSFDTSFSLQG